MTETATTNQLSITLLGNPIIAWNGGPLAISRRATRTLLYYLASEAKPVGRDKLCFLFWPDQIEKEARKNLRSLLSKLRSTLPIPGLIISYNDQVALDISQIRVDKLEFEALYGAIGTSPFVYPDNLPLPSALVDKMEQAISYWHGLYFLMDAKLIPSQGLEEWLLYTDGYLVNYRKLLTQRLVTHYEATGEINQSIRHLLTLLNYDPNNIDLHHQLLKLLVQSGQLEEARAQYRYLKDNYQSKTGNPLPEALVQDGQALEALTKIKQENNMPPWPISTSVHTQLVGRSQELDHLQNAFHQGGLAILKGESGIGKTRLMQELYQITWPACRLLYTACLDQDNAPLQVLVELIRSSVNTEDWRLLPKVWANFLGLLFPELAEIKEGLSTPEHLNSQEGYRLTFESLQTLLNIMARKQPLLVIIDNAQWLDSATLSAINFIIQKGSLQKNGLLILAFDEQYKNPKLTHFINTLSRTEDVKEINLPSLTKPEVRNLVNQIRPSFSQDNFINALADHTAGNPYFIIETLKSLRENQDLNLAKDPVIPIAKSIQALNERKIAQLDPTNVAFLKAAAILGNQFEFTILEHMLEQDSKTIIKALNYLALNGHIQEVKDTKSNTLRFTFSHNLYRDSILNSMTAPEISALHLLAAKAIETELEGQAHFRASTIANHYQAGGNYRIAVIWWLKVAQQAWSLYSRAGTNPAYQEVEKILTNFPDQVSDELLHQACKQWAKYAFESSDPDLLIKICAYSLSRGQKTDNTLLIGASLYYKSRALLLQMEKSEALKLIERAITYLKTEDDIQILRDALLHQGMCLTMLHRFSEAKVSYQQVLDTNQENLSISDRQIIFEANYHFSLMHFRTGLPKIGLEIIEEAYQKHQEVLKPYGQAQAHLSFGYNQLALGRALEAKEHVSAGLALTQSMQNKWLMEYFLYILACVEISLGNLDRGISLAKELIESATQAGRLEMVMRGQGVLGSAYLYLEDLNSAKIILEELSKTPLVSQIYFENLTRFACCLGRLGELERAEKILESVIDHSIRTELGGIHKEALLVKARFLIIKDKSDQAYELLETLIEESLAVGLINIATSAKQLLMLIAGKRKDDKAITRISDELLNKTYQTHNIWAQITALRLTAQFANPNSQSAKQKLLEAQTLMDQVTPQAQSPEIAESFMRARTNWFL